MTPILIFFRLKEYKSINGFFGDVPAQVEHPCAHRDGLSHNHFLGNATHSVVLALCGCIEEKICSFFEGGKHDRGVLHLIDTISGEPNNLAFAGHDLC